MVWFFCWPPGGYGHAENLRAVEAWFCRSQSGRENGSLAVCFFLPVTTSESDSNFTLLYLNNNMFINKCELFTF